MKESKKLSLTDLVLLNVSCVVALTSLAQVSLFSYSSILLYLIAMLLFFIPSGFMVTELNARIPKEGGFYQWTRLAFGEIHGFIVAWVYWLSNIVWLPTVAILIAGTLLYYGDESVQSLADNPVYNLIISLSVLVGITFLNIIGLEKAKWIQNIGGVAVWIIVITLVILAFIQISAGEVANTFDINTLFEPIVDIKIIPFLAIVSFAFGGLEMSSVMSDEIRNPGKNLPKSILISAILISMIYSVGSLSLITLVPAGEIDIIKGVAQGFNAASLKLESPMINYIGITLVLLSTLGLFGSWLTANARLPFVVGLDHYLPKSFAKVHPKYESPYISLIAQAIILSILFVVSMAGSTVNEAFLVLLDMSIILYFIPYLYMFMALVFHVRNQTGGNGLIKAFKSPVVLYGISILGISITLFSMAMSCIPSKEVQDPFLFLLKVIGGAVFLLGIGLAIYFSNRRKLKN